MRQDRGGTPTYREVRALDRGLRLMEALGDLGWSSPAALATRTGTDRTTVYRLLATLIATGYAVRRHEDGHVALTAKLRSLGMAVQEEDRLIGGATIALAALVEKIRWPSDFGMLTPRGLEIVASSHGLTSMTVFRALVGKSRPILHTALGRAILAAMGDDERDLMILAVRSYGGDGIEGLDDAAAVARLVEETRARGYAEAVSTFQSNISAIALPVTTPRGVAGSVNIVFFRAAMSPADAAAMYLPALGETVAQIARGLVDVAEADPAARKPDLDRGGTSA